MNNGQFSEHLYFLGDIFIIHKIIIIHHLTVKACELMRGERVIQITTKYTCRVF